MRRWEAQILVFVWWKVYFRYFSITSHEHQKKRLPRQISVTSARQVHRFKSSNLRLFQRHGATQQPPNPSESKGFHPHTSWNISWSWPNMGVYHGCVCCFTFLGSIFGDTKCIDMPRTFDTLDTHIQTPPFQTLPSFYINGNHLCAASGRDERKKQCRHILPRLATELFPPLTHLANGKRCKTHGWLLLVQPSMPPAKIPI